MKNLDSPGHSSDKPRSGRGNALKIGAAVLATGFAAGVPNQADAALLFSKSPKVVRIGSGLFDVHDRGTGNDCPSTVFYRGGVRYSIPDHLIGGEHVSQERFLQPLDLREIMKRRKRFDTGSRDAVAAEILSTVRDSVRNGIPGTLSDVDLQQALRDARNPMNQGLSGGKLDPKTQASSREAKSQTFWGKLETLQRRGDTGGPDSAEQQAIAAAGSANIDFAPLVRIAPVVPGAVGLTPAPLAPVIPPVTESREGEAAEGEIKDKTARSSSYLEGLQGNVSDNTANLNELSLKEAEGLRAKLVEELATNQEVVPELSKFQKAFQILAKRLQAGANTEERMNGASRPEGLTLRKQNSLERKKGEILGVEQNLFESLLSVLRQKGKLDAEINSYGITVGKEAEFEQIIASFDERISDYEVNRERAKELKALIQNAEEDGDKGRLAKLREDRHVVRKFLKDNEEEIQGVYEQRQESTEAFEMFSQLNASELRYHSIALGQREENQNQLGDLILAARAYEKIIKGENVETIVDRTKKLTDAVRIRAAQSTRKTVTKLQSDLLERDRRTAEEAGIRKSIDKRSYTDNYTLNVEADAEFEIIPVHDYDHSDADMEKMYEEVIAGEMLDIQAQIAAFDIDDADYLSWHDATHEKTTI